MRRFFCRRHPHESSTQDDALTGEEEKLIKAPICEGCVSLAKQPAAVSLFMATDVISVDVDPKHISGDRRVGVVLDLT